MKGMKPCWMRLNERPDIVKRLKQLPEGSKLDFCIFGPPRHFFLRIEDENLVLLTESSLGNMFTEAVEEYYPLNKVVYNIEEKHSNEDIFSLNNYSWDFKPIRKTPKDEDFNRYCELLKNCLNKKENYLNNYSF